MIRRFSAALLLTLACGAPATEEQRPAPCPEGQAAAADGRCAPLLAASCPPGSMRLVGQADCAPIGPRSCPDGFSRRADGWGCDPVQHEGACPAGAMPMLGHTDCVPVGWVQACPAGFEKDPTGWGCRAVAPAACTGATRAALGEATCVPLGDCNAAFPPAAATLFVSPTATVDATHFRTIAAAAAAAPEGATIAVDQGVYKEQVVLSRAVTLVGRCPARTVLEVPTPGMLGSGFKVRYRPVAVKGFTVRGFSNGVSAGYGATVTVEDTLIAASPGFGVACAGDPGTQTSVTVRRSVIRDGEAAPGTNDVGAGFIAAEGGRVVIEQSEVANNVGVSGTAAGLDPSGRPAELVIESSVVRGARLFSTGEMGRGLEVQDGARLTVNRSLVAGHHNWSVLLDGGKTAATITESDLRDTSDSAANVPGLDDWGRGVGALDEATVVIRRSALVSHRVGAIAASGVKADVLVEDSVLRFTEGCDLPAPCSAVTADSRGHVKLLRTAVVDPPFAGLRSLEDFPTLEAEDSLIFGGRPTKDGEFGWGALVVQGTLAMKRSAVVSALGAGVLSKRHGVLTLADSLVRETRGHPGRAQQIGVEAQDGGFIRAERSAVDENGYLSVVATGVDGSYPSQVELVGSTIRGRADGTTTRGVEVNLSGRATVEGCTLLGHQEASLTLFDRASSLTVRDTALLGAGVVAEMQGFGAFVSGGPAKLERVAVVAPRAAGLMAEGAAVVEVSQLGVYGPLGFDGQADGLVFAPGTRAKIVGAEITGTPGVGLAASQATVTGDRVLLSRNAVAVHSVGAELADIDDVEAAPAAPRVGLTRQVVFEDNEARIGSGDLPLPKAPGASPDPAK